MRALARFNFFFLSLSYTGLPRSVPPTPSSSPLHSPWGDKERDGEEKGTAKEGVRREERAAEVMEATGEENGGGGGKLGKRVPACTTRYTTCQEF